jgi:hypothetical protein
MKCTVLFSLSYVNMLTNFNNKPRSNLKIDNKKSSKVVNREIQPKAIALTVSETHPTPTPVSGIVSDSNIVTNYKVEKRYTLTLFCINLLLMFGHISLAFYILFANISYSLYFSNFEIKSSLSDDIKCLYDYGVNDMRCSHSEWTLSRSILPPSSCESILSNTTDFSSQHIELGGSMQIYYGLAHNSDIQLCRWILLSVQIVSFIACLLNVVIFVRMYRELSRNCTHMYSWFLRNGGLTLKWFDYSITVSLLMIYVSNISNFYDLYGTISIVLSTIAFMYIGMVTETFIVIGYVFQPFIMVYIASFALFTSVWSPILQSIMNVVFESSCNSNIVDSIFYCQNPSCFGKEVPIIPFTVTLLFLFGNFLLIMIYKIYTIGNWFKQIDEHIFAIVNIMTLQSYDGIKVICSPIFWFVISTLRFVLFLVFCVSGFFIAYFSVLKYFLNPFLPHRFLNEPVKNNIPIAQGQLFVTEIMFLIASSAFKLYLVIFFILNFKDLPV